MPSTSFHRSLNRGFRSVRQNVRPLPAWTALAPAPMPQAILRRLRGLGARRQAIHPHSRVVVALFVGYLIFAAALTYVRGGTFLTPDRIAILLLAGAVVAGQGKAFVRDWAPFVLLLFGYELMRGVADNMADLGAMTATDHGDVQVDWLIHADKALFWGRIPSLWLQDRLYVPGTVHWYDVLAAVVYLLHFVFPLLFGFTLWLRSRETFRQFCIALLVMSYGAFVFYLLLPTAPPWMAQQWGMLDGLERPSHQAYKLFLPHGLADYDTFKIWTHASPNPVAALPSLHAAFPWLVQLFAVRLLGRRAWVFLLYNAAVWFSVVYLSQHWVIDVIAGITWATAVFFAVDRLRNQSGSSTLGRARTWRPTLAPRSAEHAAR